jgi:hypothetical protein
LPGVVVVLAAWMSGGRDVVSARTVERLLDESGYSLQGNRKTIEGASHPDRNARFEYIDASVINTGTDPECWHGEYQDVRQGVCGSVGESACKNTG